VRSRQWSKGGSNEKSWHGDKGDGLHKEGGKTVEEGKRGNPLGTERLLGVGKANG